MAAKKYEELTFSDDFMFCKVLQHNPQLCRELLELVLGRQVGELVTLERQHPVEITADKRGVRFDVYARDDDSVVYDVEMQNALRDHLPKRTRYIQGLLDLEMLERGAHFSELQESFVIFICRFNLLDEAGRHRYSFRNLCVEDPSLELEDGTEKIFLCTEGAAEDISPEMKQFLAYVAGNTPESSFAKRLEDAVAKARLNPAWRKEFMDLQDYVDIAKEEGRKEGLKQGREEGLQQGREEERKNTEREAARADAAESRANAAESRADAVEAELAQLKLRLAELESRGIGKESIN